jgi:hypothetical protein
MKTLAAFILIPFCAAAALSPGEVESLITAARNLPPEFSADALIRISGLEGLSRAQRITLLEQAFGQAGKAQQPYRRRLAGAATPEPAAFLNKVNQQGLDGLDLELRAVEAILPLDAARARQLFQSIPPLKVPHVGCEEWMVYDVDLFYRVLAALAESFTGAEKNAGAAARLVKPYAAVTSPVEIGPMAAMLAAPGWSDADFSALLNAFAAALGKVTGDDRSFTASYGGAARVEGLVKECKRRSVSPLPLLEAYRLHLVVGLSAARCADDDAMGVGGPMVGSAFAGADQRVTDVVAFFNDRLRMDPLQAIQEGESTPAQVGGTAEATQGCDSEACHAIASRYRGLLFGAQNLPVPPEDRQTPDWRKRLRELLASIAEWKPASRAEAAGVYRDKVLLYSGLLNVAPPGEARDSVLRAELDFVIAGRAAAASRAEWFLPVNALLARTTIDPLGFGSFRAVLRQAADPVVALYARLEEVAPRSQEKAIGLL